MSTETIRLIRDGIIIIMKGIFIVFLVPMYHTVWECRVLYNNSNNKHTHTWVHVGWWGVVRHSCEKDSLEIVEQVCVEGGIERGGGNRVVECLRQALPNSWASIRKR